MIDSSPAAASPTPLAAVPPAIGGTGIAADTVPPSPSLDHLALLRVAGADARAFLDGQLTRNVPAAGIDGGPGATSLAGYCSPKGRLLATFVVWSDAEQILLVVSRDIATAVAKRLRMYVLRAKVTIEEATDRIDGVGLPADTSFPIWQAIAEDRCAWLRLPDADGEARALRIGSTEADQRLRPPVVAATRWAWMEIRAGLPRVVAATQDRFVPQMLNLEALGAVDFKKGCFPGQEIVARSQYLGKLKRRTALVVVAGNDVPPAGTDIWQSGGTEAAGVVVNAERGPDGRIAALAELPTALFAATDLHAGTPDGPALTIEALPYPLPDNEVFVRPRL